MPDISGIGPIHVTSPLNAKLKVSLDKSGSAQEPVSLELRQAEVEMQNAERAFALMMEIRQKIEASYGAIREEK